MADTTTASGPIYAPGLEGVVVAQTKLCYIDGEKGELLYVGYDIEDLARHTSFEEVAFLLWNLRLPNRSELDQLKADLTAERALLPEVVDHLKRYPRDAHPMAVLRTAVSLLGLVDPEAEDMSEAAHRRKAIRLTAKIPSLVAAYDRLRKGNAPVEPRPDLDTAGNFLYMLNAELPRPIEARTFDAALVLHAEHGMNASTFAARVTASTRSDLHSAVVSAIGALKGPAHGGANEEVMKMLLEIDRSGVDPAEWVRQRLERGERIMGFGHRVYRTVDPRAIVLRELAEQIMKERGDTKWLELSDRIRAVMAEEMERRGKRVYPNVDFFSASVYKTLGIDLDLFPAVFAMARITGWTAHLFEQYANNRLIRPEAEYVGPRGLKVVPLDQR